MFRIHIGLRQNRIIYRAGGACPSPTVQNDHLTDKLEFVELLQLLSCLKRTFADAAKKAARRQPLHPSIKNAGRFARQNGG